MKIAMLYLALLGQVPEEIQYCETVKSKFYIQVQLPSGSYIKVPVVNGYLPEVMTRQDEDGYKRVLNYNREIPYNGGVPRYLPQTQPLKQCTVPQPIQRLTPIPQRLSEKSKDGWVPKTLKPSSIDNGTKKPTY